MNAGVQQKYLNPVTNCGPNSGTKCYGPEISQCLECKNDLGYFFLPSRTLCTQFCPEGYAGNLTLLATSVASCEACDTNCTTCSSTNRTHCLSCVAGSFLKNNACVNASSCGDGFYPDNLTKNCSSCNPACAICFGPLIN